MVNVHTHKGNYFVKNRTKSVAFQKDRETFSTSINSLAFA